MTDPAPLTPHDCDLRAFRDMPLDIGRFRDSDLVTIGSPESVLAAILLWGAAWHQVPAASLPNDDRVLARLAGYGRAVEAWREIRDDALRGFVLCSDGRLYHRVLAEKANNSWDKRLAHNWQKAKDRHRKAQRDLQEQERTEFPDFDDWKAGREPPEPAPRNDPEFPLESPDRSGGKSSVRAHGTRAPAHTGASIVPRAHLEHSSGNDRQFQRNEPSIPLDFALKGREGKGVLYSTQPNPSHSNSRDGDLESGSGRDGDDNPNDGLPASAQLYRDVCDASGFSPTDQDQIKRNTKTVAAWYLAGIDFDLVVLPTIRAMVAKEPGPTRTLSRFTRQIKHEHARALAKGLNGATYHPPASPITEPPDEDPAFRPLRAALLAQMGAPTYSVTLNSLRFSAHPDDKRSPLVVKGPAYAVSTFVDSATTGPVAKIIKAHGFKDLWNG